MAASDILLGRGVVTIGGDDVGQCSALAVRHQVQEALVARWDLLTLGGTAEIARRTRVLVDLTLHELTADNRAKLLDLSLDPSAVALVWTGKNTMAADCPASSWSLSVPSFILSPLSRLALISPSFSDAELAVSGEAMRAAAATTWYTLSVA